MGKRVILISGGNGGLAQATARAFLAENAENVLVLGVRANRSRVESLAREFPGRCEPVDLEVTQAESWKRAVDRVLERHERLDVLVNNAGGHQDGLLATLTAAAWDQVLATNLDAVFHGCQAVLSTMIHQRQGRIVNIASLSALAAPAGQANYAAAKAGVVALSQSLAKEVARIGITVNVVCPGFVDTEALASLSAEEKKAAQQRIPMRRFGRPAEVAAAVLFLACAEASYITGSVLKVDGGVL